MKIIKLGLIIILASIILSTCSEKKNRVEIVPNLENEYLSLNDVDSLPKMGKDFNQKMNKDFGAAVKNLHVNNPNVWTLFRIDIRVYLNENGRVDKIKDLNSNQFAFNLPDSVISYDDYIKLDKQLALKLEKWKLGPAKKDGKKVKVWFDLKSEISLNPRGVYSVGSPRFLLLPMPLRENFDKMPSIVKSFKPHFPTIAKLKGKEGKVYVKVYVNSQGKPITAIIFKSDNEVFNQPSIDAAMKFKFSPAMKDNTPVGAWVVVPFKYISDLSNEDELSQTTFKNKFYVAAEQMPEPIGGIKAIQKKIKYPKTAKQERIEGRVYILTFIDEKGKVVSANVIKGIGGGCDEAALKAVEETKFTPGRQHGKPVKTQVTIPVFFTLK